MPRVGLEALATLLLLFGGGVSIGLAGLLVRRTHRPSWWIGFFLPVIILIAAGTAAAALRSWLVLSIGAVPSVCSMVLFGLQRWHEPLLRWFTTIIRLPRLHAGLLVTLGSVGAAYYAVHFDRAHEAPEAEFVEPIIDDAEFVGRIFQPDTPALAATTDTGMAINVYVPPVDPAAAPLLQEREKQIISGMHERLIRTKPVDPRYNCFGWVFTDGLGWMTAPDVERVLKDHGYEQVRKPVPGDIVAYKKQDGICHAGIVTTVRGNRVIVESKWGPYGRFLHAVEDQPFSSEYTFHRTTRPNHWLRRLTPDS